MENNDRILQYLTIEYREVEWKCHSNRHRQVLCLKS